MEGGQGGSRARLAIVSSAMARKATALYRHCSSSTVVPHTIPYGVLCTAAPQQDRREYKVHK